jgi:hypothetical protein
MIDQEAPGIPTPSRANACYFFRFGLIVTGKAEQEHLPKLFSSLVATGICKFEVIRQIGQRSPIEASHRRARMVGSGQTITTKDEEEIGLPARRYLGDDPCSFVILVDDLEFARRENAQQVFNRYRLAMDTILTPIQKPRASVHFLVNMLEAYYFADARAVNAVLNLQPALEDFADDVEDIRHPKNDLKQRHIGYDEVGDGGRILDNIRIEHILSRPYVCRWLRTLLAWCVKVLERYPDYGLLNLTFNEGLRLNDGVLSDVTRTQLEGL